MAGERGLYAGPVEVMLCRAQETIPAAAALAGGTVLEPKYDGFRAVLQVTPAGRVRYWSRKGTDLSAAFPDLVDAARDQVPAGVVLDGEAVVWVDGRLSFDHLQHRIVSAPAAAVRMAPPSCGARAVAALYRRKTNRSLAEPSGAGSVRPQQMNPKRS